MRSRDGNGYEAAARLSRNEACVITQKDRIELNELSRCSGEYVNRSRARVRVRPLHVNDALIFRNFGLRKMSMEQRRFTRIGVEMEQRSVKRGH